MIGFRCNNGVGTVAHNCRVKRNDLAAKERDSRQKKEPHGRRKKPHGKKNNLAAKEKEYKYRRSVLTCKTP